MATNPTSSDVAPLVSKVKQWTIGADGTGPVVSKNRFTDTPAHSYNLKNRMLRKFLQHEHQTFGINLGWTDDAEPETAKQVARWFFPLPDETVRPIRYGERLALGNGNQPSFIRYASRDLGINLDWSNSPHCEWKLLGGPTGRPVQRGEYLAIYNTTTKHFLMYFDRNVGGDIGWEDSKRWGTQLLGEAADLLEKYGEDAVRDAVMKSLAA
jgi:hypothetical protein